MDLETIKKIKENYKRMEEDYVKQLFFSVPHGSTIGRYREQIWGKMFEAIVPKKFVIEQSVFIIDSAGNVSNEVDLAIFDEMYTPYVFRYGQIKFIPIEAVAAVVECKSTSMDKDLLKKWVERIKSLETSAQSVARTAAGVICGSAPTQTATRPLRILCCLNEEYKDLQEVVDFDVTIRAGEERLKIEWSSKRKSLYDWYQALNHVKGEKQSPKPASEVAEQNLDSYEVQLNGEKLSLMIFNFQFNQILMLINNPMLFPHLAYAKLFNKEGES